MSATASLKDFWSAARAAAAAGELLKLTLSKPAHGGKDLPRNRYGRLVEIKNRTLLQITHRYNDREEVKNHPINEGLALMENALGTDYHNADLFSTTEKFSLILSRKGNARVLRQPALHPRPRPDVSLPKLKDLVVTEHNREKHRDIPADRPYLKDLGITNAKGEVRADGKRKFKQINKFVEIIAALLREHPLKDGAHIVDMGSGSGYLTFALYDHLVNTLDLDVNCCQKQVRRDMVVPEDLKPLLSNGILLERQAAMLTDGLRALLLQAEGYKTKLFEFIPLEHTAKNVMITAIKGKKKPKALEEFRTLRKRFGVKKHYLRKLIKSPPTSKGGGKG